jgi:hypothetical protein
MSLLTTKATVSPGFPVDMLVRRVIWLNTASVGPLGAAVGPQRGQVRWRGAKLAQSPWLPLSIGLRSYRSIWSQVQFPPFPCGEGERGAA